MKINYSDYSVTSPECVYQWGISDLSCVAGRREFNLNRYSVYIVYPDCNIENILNNFKSEVIEFEKTALLLILKSEKNKNASAAEAIYQLANLVSSIKGQPTAEELCDGETFKFPIKLICPVTGVQATYYFYGVAFCPHANHTEDPLYDPSLSTPFSCINMTSDAFAFAMLVRDISLKKYNLLPYHLNCKMAFKNLLNEGVKKWQAMSIKTIQAFTKKTAGTKREVYLENQEKFWVAYHQDPVFAEHSKQPHRHEMPLTYAQRLVNRWIEAMYQKNTAEMTAFSEGQQGGVIIE